MNYHLVAENTSPNITVYMAIAKLCSTTRRSANVFAFLPKQAVGFVKPHWLQPYMILSPVFVQTGELLLLTWKPLCIKLFVVSEFLEGTVGY